LPLIMYDLSGGSAIVMTSMRTAELLPNLFFGILVGVLVDRINKKIWAIWMILSQGVVLIGIYLMFGANLYEPVIFYMFGFVLMTLNYGFFNTQISLIKLTVPINMITSANAKFSFVETFVSIMGPVILSFVLLFLNKVQGILVTVFLYILAFILIKNLTITEKRRDISNKTLWGDLREGWQSFKENTALKLLTIFIILLNSTMTIVATTALILGTADLNLTNSSLSMVLSVAGVGGLIASLSINWLRKKCKLGAVLGISILLSAVAYLIFYITANVWQFSLALLINGFATTIYIICAYTFRHEQTPTNLMGRISGITGTLFRLGMPIAMLISGWMISCWGTSSVFISSAIFNSIVFLFYRQSILWKLE